MALDNRITAILDLSANADDAEIAKRLAALGNARPPRSKEEITLWMALARAIQKHLIREDNQRMDATEAAHYVVSETSNSTRENSDLWWEMFGLDRSRRDPNPYGALRGLVERHFLRQLAEAGGFRLIYD